LVRKFLVDTTVTNQVDYLCEVVRLALATPGYNLNPSFLETSARTERSKYRAPMCSLTSPDDTPMAGLTRLE